MTSTCNDTVYPLDKIIGPPNNWGMVVNLKKAGLREVTES